MFKTLIFYLLLEKRNIYINKYIFPLRVLSSLLNMIFYYYAAKAFLPNKDFFTEAGNTNLFEYVMVGELTLSLVSDSLLIFSHHIKKILNFNIFDSLLNTKSSMYRILLQNGISSLILSILLIITEMSMLYWIFGLTFPLLNLFGAIITNLIFIPLFISLGIVSASLFIIFKRGTSLMGTFVTLLSLVSGVYFPIETFPKIFSKLLVNINPFQFLISETRLILSEGLYSPRYLTYIVVVLLLNIIMSFAARSILSFSVRVYKRRGTKIWLTS